MNRSRLVRSVVAAASLALLAGCSGGLAGGEAAKVGDQTLSRAHVDDAAEGLCLAIGEQLDAQGQQLANVQLRQSIVQILTLRMMGDQVAEDYGVEAGADYVDVRNQVEALLGEVPEELHEAVIDSETTQQYLESVTTAAGRVALEAEGGADPTDEEAALRGQDIFSEVLVDADVSLDPRYGLVFTEAGVEVGDSSSSQAVSYPASQGVARPETGTVDPDADWVMALPSSQRCG